MHLTAARFRSGVYLLLSGGTPVGCPIPVAIPVPIPVEWVCSIPVGWLCPVPVGWSCLIPVGGVLADSGRMSWLDSRRVVLARFAWDVLQPTAYTVLPHSLRWGPAQLASIQRKLPFICGGRYMVPHGFCEALGFWRHPPFGAPTHPPRMLVPHGIIPQGLLGGSRSRASGFPLVSTPHKSGRRVTTTTWRGSAPPHSV
jgi:hypothetical protein